MSRWETNNNVPIPVTVNYMVNDPAGLPKAIVLLFAGGTGEAGIMGGTNGTVARTGTNFLVRSAQLFANASYRAVTVDSPAGSYVFNVTTSVSNQQVTVNLPNYSLPNASEPPVLSIEMNAALVRIGFLVSRSPDVFRREEKVKKYSTEMKYEKLSSVFAWLAAGRPIDL